VFAVQTLVENAVRHGAAPRVDPTTIELTASVTGEMLTVAVHDNGDGASLRDLPSSNGTGLARLRERLAVLYEGRARLDLASEPNGGFAASFAAPFDAG
jgi:LytS/YehU family sensor histidine kinase